MLIGMECANGDSSTDNAVDETDHFSPLQCFMHHFVRERTGAEAVLSLADLARISAALDKQEGQLEQELVDAEGRLCVATRRSEDLRCQLRFIRAMVGSKDQTPYCERPQAMQCDFHDSNGDLSSVSLSCSSVEQRTEVLTDLYAGEGGTHCTLTENQSPPDIHPDGFSLW